jgi:hypothetical protein
MKSRVHPVAFALAVGFAFSAIWVMSCAQSVNNKPKYLLTPRSLVLLSPAQIVAGPIVLDAKWSADGVRVAAVRHTMRSALGSVVPEMRLVVWSAGSPSREIWNRDMNPTTVPRVAWITPDTVTVELKWSDISQATDSAGNVRYTETPHQAILWADTVHNQVKTIEEMPGDRLYVAHNHPFAALVSPAQHQILLMKPDGNVLRRTPLPANVTLQQRDSEDRSWYDDLHLQMDSITPADGGHDATFHTLALDIQTGAFTEDFTPATPARKILPSAFRLVGTEQEVKFGHRTQRLHPLWLESTTGGDRPEVLLAGDGAGGTLSPTGEAVLYLSEQAAWVTALHIGPKEPFVSNIKAALQSNAKQLGLAMRMYAQDYDDALPAPGSGVQSAFEPYHKNNDIYDGFNYTFGGGTIAADKLAQTEIGTVDGPGGRFIIYGDGRVVWKSP